MKRLQVGQLAVILHSITSAPTGDAPAMLYFRKGDVVRICAHRPAESVYDYTVSFPHEYENDSGVFVHYTEIEALHRPYGFVGRRELKQTNSIRYITEGNAIWWMNEHGVDVYLTCIPPHYYEPKYGHNLPREWALGVRDPNTGHICFEWLDDNFNPIIELPT